MREDIKKLKNDAVKVGNDFISTGKDLWNGFKNKLKSNEIIQSAESAKLLRIKYFPTGKKLYFKFKNDDATYIFDDRYYTPMLIKEK